MGERVVVTGAAGFIGSAVCAALLDAGDEVLGIDNFDPFYSRAVKARRLTALVRRPQFTFRDADVRAEATVTRMLAKADVLIHLAARAGVAPSLNKPVLYRDLNVRGTRAVLCAARHAAVARVVFASSSSVYGAGRVPFVEGATRLRPLSPYAATKLAGERECDALARDTGARVAGIRLFSVYGPEQRPDQVIHRFSRRLVLGRSLPRYGDGGAERDYTFIGDAVAGIVRAARWTATASPGFDAFNIGSGRGIGLDEVIHRLGTALGIAPRISPRPARAGDVPCTRAALGKARATLGYVPTVDFADGLAAFLQWFEVAHGRQSRAAS